MKDNPLIEDIREHFGFPADDQLHYEQYHRKHLMSFGFAAGNYVGKCGECGKEMIADKRARTCYDCAHSDFHLHANADSLFDAAEQLQALIVNDSDPHYFHTEQHILLSKALDYCRGLGDHEQTEDTP